MSDSERRTMTDVDEAVRRHVGDDGVPGATWAVARGGAVHLGAAGSFDAAGRRPVAPDAIFRISSATKPIVAVGALVLVDDGTIGLDDPVDDLLPELADRRVIARPDGPLDETVAAVRPITVRDLLNSTPDQLLSIANFGEKTLEEVYKALEKFGFYRASRQKAMAV